MLFLLTGVLDILAQVFSDSRFFIGTLVDFEGAQPPFVS
jgi:hypothetical protein